MEMGEDALGGAGPQESRLFVFNNCRQFIRTVPALLCDEVDMADVDSRTVEAQHAPEQLTVLVSQVVDDVGCGQASIQDDQVKGDDFPPPDTHRNGHIDTIREPRR